MVYVVVNQILESLQNDTNASRQMKLIVPKDQGHNMWRGFFECKELVDFVINCANNTVPALPKLNYCGQEVNSLRVRLFQMVQYIFQM